MSQLDLPPGFDFEQAGKDVLTIERAGLEQLDQYINADFARACESMFYCRGKVVVMGMGKSGHIGKKMAATFASTGTPSFFVHPAEASHGDLGMVSPQDIVIAISNSGESNEILALIPVLKRLQVQLICVTGRPESAMAKAADIHLCIKVPQEACPLGLAPTTSTTATLVMGDALAVALLFRAALRLKISRFRIRAARSGASCCCGLTTSCTPAMKFRTSAKRPLCATRFWKSPARILA
ncbi:Arabinose 5-phosphate isomerase [Cronobacter universalis NCTC 9529]|nr:Arabinose 5-phosphate isomerase [Cronobacter universalis NCTC 9529]